jgi:hypothetical protein
MAYSKAKLKSSGDRASPCFRLFLIGNAPGKSFVNEELKLYPQEKIGKYL